MKATKMKTIALIILLATRLLAQTRPAVELEGAIAKEQVDGDLKTAIAIYQKIAADGSAPRDLRARALLHQARCYEKLGQQAQTLYRQIVRDFGDQPEAVQAKARLAALREADHPAVPVGMTQRKIDNPGTMSMNPGDTDGRRAVYLNAAGELIYGDLSGKSKRVIFKPKLDDLPRWFPSRDFSMVLLVLHADKRDRPRTLAIVNTGGTGYREIAKLDFPNYASNDFRLTWSWDNRYILCVQNLGGTSRLLRIAVADGRIRELLSLKTGMVRHAVFSPDSRFVAYQVPAPSDANPVSRIFVLPADGEEPQPVYEERQTAGYSASSPALKLLDWTADGRFLSIASGRTGKGGLELLPISGGKSAGAPVFVKGGNFEDGITTASGNLVYKSLKTGGLWAVYLASLDSNSRPGDWKRLDLDLGNTLNPTPHWSSDGNQIVYVARSEDTGQIGAKVVHVRNLSTGEDREIYRTLGYPTCTWASQQPRLFCIDAADKTEIFSIAVDSGEIARLHTFPAPRLLVIDRPSRDDSALFIRDYLRGRTDLVRWEIATGQETILGGRGETFAPKVSPDERWLFWLTGQNLETGPASGGEWKPVLSLRQETGHFNLTTDGNWLVYHDVDSAGKHGLFRVATAGGSPERLGDFPTNSSYGTIEISPDGSKIMVSAGDYSNGYELWSLENFVPAAPKQ